VSAPDERKAPIRQSCQIDPPTEYEGCEADCSHPLTVEWARYFLEDDAVKGDSAAIDRSPVVEDVASVSSGEGDRFSQLGTLARPSRYRRQRREFVPFDAICLETA
jgi:hypothetical protein